MQTNQAVNGRLRVAIFGRPNVGKSTLFNQLTGTRKAVVKDQPGVTRDIHSGIAEWRSIKFEIFDTAGVTEGGDEAWSDAIRRQALKAAEAADRVIFVLDGKYGLNPEDKNLAQFINRLKKPVLAVVNKLDEFETQEIGLAEFYGLGFETMIAASFEHKIGLENICDWVIEDLDYDEAIKNVFTEEKSIRIAVVGKPNAGKSTLVNSLLGEERVVVSPMAGTTIDSVEVPFKRNNQDFILIDTAGLRRHAKRRDHVEQISARKSEESVVSADILLLMIDGLEGPSHQDARIVEMVLEHHRAVILVVNKIDLCEGKIPRFREKMGAQIETTFHFYHDIPVVYISATTTRGVETLFTKIEKIWRALNLQISTREINEFFFNIIRQAPSPSYRGNDIKFYYITQTKQRPPSFMCFVNEPRGVTSSYKRFLSSKIKIEYDLVGIPVRIYPKKRRRGATKAADVSYGHLNDKATKVVKVSKSSKPGRDDMM
jgi:GTP-binding protein